ncbi:MAG: phosphatidylserine decarboxylase [Spirochaetes bacterium]|nr:phosphatidylserine decarboxylase [Spirochaetota bacterium]
MNGFLIFFFHIIPKAFLSRIFGSFARSRLSAHIMLNWFVNRFKINLNETQIPEKGFRTMDEFFTRKLKPGIHNIDRTPNAVVSPVDAVVAEFGPVTGTRVLQAKNIDYLLADIIPNHMHHFFIDGSFVTLYLSPSDYHRIHSPVDGDVMGYLYIPGKLFPVAEFMTEGVNRLFCKNERMISFIQTSHGKCAIIKVGAMNVGRISLSYDDFETNKTAFRKKRENFYNSAFQPQLTRGDEIGAFHLGSTVIMLFEKDMINWHILRQNQRVRVGQKLGEFKKKEL